MTLKNTFALFLLLAFAGAWNGCVKKDQQKGLVYVNDFENMKGWAPLMNLTKFPVHGGVYAGKLDSAHTFGPTLRLKFDEISPVSVRKVKYSMWVYLKSKQALGKMVVGIDGPDGKNVYWDAQHVGDIVKEAGRWTEMKGEFVLGKNNAPQNVISIYPWSVAKEDFYVDDVRIEFVL